MRPNASLPSLPVWRARSFWAQLLLLAVGLASLLGIDLLASLSAMGLGDSPEEVLATGERAVAAANVILMIGAGVWAWVERQAPHHRLVWRRGPNADEESGRG
jgi:hypothetical protein